MLRVMRGKHGHKNSDQLPIVPAANRILGIPRRHLIRFRVGAVSLPKIISAGNDDAIRIELTRDDTYISPKFGSGSV